MSDPSKVPSELPPLESWITGTGHEDDFAQIAQDTNSLEKVTSIATRAFSGANQTQRGNILRNFENAISGAKTHEMEAGIVDPAIEKAERNFQQLAVRTALKQDGKSPYFTKEWLATADNLVYLMIVADFELSASPTSKERSTILANVRKVLDNNAEIIGNALKSSGKSNFFSKNLQRIPNYLETVYKVAEREYPNASKEEREQILIHLQSINPNHPLIAKLKAIPVFEAAEKEFPYATQERRKQILSNLVSIDPKHPLIAKLLAVPVFEAAEKEFPSATQDRRMQILSNLLSINPKHPLIAKLKDLIRFEADANRFPKATVSEREEMLSNLLSVNCEHRFIAKLIADSVGSSRFPLSTNLLQNPRYKKLVLIYAEIEFKYASAKKRQVILDNLKKMADRYHKINAFLTEQEVQRLHLKLSTINKRKGAGRRE